MVTVISIIAGSLALIYVGIIINFIAGWQKLKTPKRPFAAPATTVTVLVCARNEEKYIGDTIRAILAQDYPAELLEIMVVNDHSEDRTGEIVAAFGPMVTLIDLNLADPINSYKKAGLERGISQSTGKLIVVTDADCTMGTRWLSGIVGFYEQHGYKMISAPVAYYKERNVFERLQALEFSFLIGMGASAIGNAKPVTCNGANLAYERAAFDAVGGFEGIDALASGDDELLLHKVRTRFPDAIGFLKSRDSIVYTFAKDTLSEFIAQRKRWASKSTSYKDRALIYLGVAMWIFSVAILLVGIAGIFDQQLLLLAAQLLLVKVLFEGIFLSMICNFFHRRLLLFLLPILSVLHIVYLIYIGLSGNIGNYNWKGRNVK